MHDQYGAQLQGLGGTGFLGRIEEGARVDGVNGQQKGRGPVAKDAAIYEAYMQGHGGVYHGILRNQDNIHEMMMIDNLDEDRACN